MQMKSTMHCYQVDMYGVKERVQGVIVSLTGDTKPNTCGLYLLNLLTLFMPDRSLSMQARCQKPEMILVPHTCV